MSFPKVVSRDEWQAARRAFLAEEKAFTRERDALNARRRELPVVLVDKEYRFEVPGGGRAGLLDLFDGRRQLIVYHFMPRFDTGEWCPACSFWVDNMGHPAHLHARDTSLVVVCPEPPAEIEAFWRRKGWTIPWVSSHGSDFDHDFHIDLSGMFASDGDDASDDHCGTAQPELEAPGVSVFLRGGDSVYHSYSTYRRGSDLLNNTYNYLDLTPLGRQEEELSDPMEWLRHHDEYDF